MYINKIIPTCLLFLYSILIPSVMSQEYSIDEHTVALWHFDEANYTSGGDTFFDETNNFQGLAYLGIPNRMLVKNAIFENAVFVNNNRQSCSSYIQIYGSPITLNNSFTIEAYVLLFDYWRQPIISQYTDQKSIPEPLLELWNNKPRINLVQIFNDTTGAAAGFYLESNTTLIPNKWYHIAVTYKKPRLALWINGKINSRANVGQIMPIFQGSPYIFDIGRSSFSGASCPYFYGLIDELRISDIERTEFNVNSDLLTNVSLDSLQFVEVKTKEPLEERKIDSFNEAKPLVENTKNENDLSPTMFFLMVLLLFAYLLYRKDKKEAIKKEMALKLEKERLKTKELISKAKKYASELESKNAMDILKDAEEKLKQEDYEAVKDIVATATSTADADFNERQKAKGLQKYKGKWSTLEQIKQWKEIDTGLSTNFSNLTHFEFEHFVAKLFQKMGYQTTVTKKTGDYGIDVLAKKDNDMIAIQVKKNSHGNNVGDVVVQNTLGSMWRYKANKAIIITTSDFTVMAHEQAKEAPIELWNKTKLHQIVRKYLMDI